MEQTKITVRALVRATVEHTWKCWSDPADIVNWNAASDDWHTPWAVNDLRTGGTFTSRMEARDGSMGFDFGGVYDNVVIHRKIEYTMGDGRKVSVDFIPVETGTEVVETFDAEGIHPVEMQRSGWQAILDRFAKYAGEV